MEFETERLTLKLLTLKDLEDLHEMNSYFEVSEFNTIGVPKDFSEIKKLFQSVIEEGMNPNPKKCLWAIRLKTDGEFVGNIGMSFSIPKYSSAEIHYALHPSKWGNGYASEAVKKLLEYGFLSLGIHRIEAGVATGNAKSIKLLEALGFMQEGIRRKILPIRGEWSDNYQYAMLEEDYKSLN